MHSMNTPTLPRCQNGAALLVGLLLLLVLSLLGVTAMQASTVQERLAGNTRDLNTAFQAAEAALREGESLLMLATVPNPVGANGWYRFDMAGKPHWRTREQWESPSFVSLEYAGIAEDWGLARAPRFAFEELPPIPDPGSAAEAGAALPDEAAYRVSAVGYGGSAQTVVVLQTTYRR